MADLQVTCITKPNPQSPHEHITYLGNPAGSWKWTREEVITSIDAKAHTFFVFDPVSGKRSEVRVVRSAGKHHIFERMQMEIGTTTFFRYLNVLNHWWPIGRQGSLPNSSL